MSFVFGEHEENFKVMTGSHKDIKLHLRTHCSLFTWSHVWKRRRRSSQEMSCLHLLFTPVLQSAGEHNPHVGPDPDPAGPAAGGSSWTGPPRPQCSGSDCSGGTWPLMCLFICCCFVLVCFMCWEVRSEPSHSRCGPGAGLYQVSSRSLSGLYQVSTRSLSGLYQVSSRSLVGLYQVSSRSLSGLNQVSIRSLVGLYQVSSRSLSGLYQVSSRSLSGLYQASSRPLAGLYQVSSRSLPGL